MNLSYLDAFIQTGKNILNKDVKKLKALYDSLNYRKLPAETIRRGIQLTMIKAIREDKIQANHQVTPDLIAFIMGYIMIRIVEKHHRLKLLDLSVGTGNLLFAIMHQLKQAIHCKITATGVDNDDTLLSIASISAKLQRRKVNLIHQDAVMDFKPDDNDLVVSDLPIGYYPLDRNAKSYQTRITKGHSYAHHLLIEQAMNHVKPGGFGEFLVPSTLFDTPQSKALLKWMETDVYLQGMLNLPSELFANKRAQKAILLLQRRGGDAKQAKRVMIGEFPSFKKPDEFQKFIAEIVEWEKHDLLNN
ncbi:MAG: class I SAM-dependent methyltransferase [Acetilactobacillus jinshanensis]